MNQNLLHKLRDKRLLTIIISIIAVSTWLGLDIPNIYEYFSNQPEILKEKEISFTLSKALTLEREGQLNVAKSYYDLILENFPNNSEALFGKASALSKLRQYEESQEIYEEIMQNIPNYENAPIRAIIVTPHLPAYAKLKIWDTEVLGIDPENPTPVYIKGTRSDLDIYNASINWINYLLNAEPRLIGALNNKGSELLGQMEYENAAILFDKALEIEPRYVEAINNKGIVFFELENYEEALSWYDKALEVNENNIWTLNQKGYTLEHLGRHDEASMWYNKAVKLEKQN